MTLQYYQAYGLCIASEIAFDALQHCNPPAASPDLFIRLGAVAERPSDPEAAGSMEIAPDSVFLQLNGLARFMIKRDLIIVDLDASASLDQVRLILIGSALSATLYLQGAFLLHGSAIDTPYGAMAFVGPQTAGKSTMAAHFHQRGHAVLCDDVCPIRLDETGAPVLYPAVRQLRLCEDAVDRLDELKFAAGPPQFEVDKFAVRVQRANPVTARPLRVVHVLTLSPGAAGEVKVLRGFEQFHGVISNSYRPYYLNGLETRADVMRVGHALASQVYVIEVNRCEAGDFEEQLDEIEGLWEALLGAGKEETAECRK